MTTPNFWEYLLSKNSERFIKDHVTYEEARSRIHDAIGVYYDLVIMVKKQELSDGMPTFSKTTSKTGKICRLGILLL